MYLYNTDYNIKIYSSLNPRKKVKMAYLKQRPLEVYSMCILLVTLLFSFHSAFAVEDETIIFHGESYRRFSDEEQVKMIWQS